MPKICSWDVGIKNLAYCIINQKENTFEIEKWNIINLMEDINKKLVCCSKIKSGNLCNKKASYTGSKNGEIYPYCKIHMKLYESFTIDDINVNEINVNEMKE